MPEAAETKADTAAAPEKAAVVIKKKSAKKKKGGDVSVRNISDRLVNTSKGSIPPDECGFATEQECRSLGKFLEKT